MASSPPAANESPIEITRQNFRLAATKLGLDADMQTLLSTPFREIRVEVPVPRPAGKPHMQTLCTPAPPLLSLPHARPASLHCVRMVFTGGESGASPHCGRCDTDKNSKTSALQPSSPP